MHLFNFKDGADEWKVWNKMGDPVEHIALRDWATVCIVAPLSAHSLAKFANGLCDDTLSCIIRAWNFGPSGKRLILAPAMNVAMWEHPITAQQLNQIVGFGITSDKDASCVHVISPQEKMLACGEVGIGAMADVSLIVDTVSLLLHPRLST
jgi:phosphopantothenoylcysteine decarboxylase